MLSTDYLFKSCTNAKVSLMLKPEKLQVQEYLSNVSSSDITDCEGMDTDVFKFDENVSGYRCGYNKNKVSGYFAILFAKRWSMPNLISLNGFIRHIKESMHTHISPWRVTLKMYTHFKKSDSGTAKALKLW